MIQSYINICIAIIVTFATIAVSIIGMFLLLMAIDFFKQEIKEYKDEHRKSKERK